MRLVYGMMLLAMFGFTTLGLTGCSSNTDTVSTEEHVDHDHEGEDHAEHDHSGWWCNEHGVPEDECALCKTSLVADFKSKGDWCDEHDRPDSQCFECNPENFEKFAARYEAKFGEQPPKPTE
ncbi:MAG: hypothetical protein KDA89_01465 [Planctomycetaceae bacterium]|nr:hypothetical protein [Planctomycetaceae bacterium]